MPSITTPFSVNAQCTSKYTRTDFPGWTFDQGSANTTGDFRLSDVRVTNKNPNWKQLVAKKIDAGTIYRRSVSSRKPCRIFTQAHGLASIYPRHYFDSYFVGSHWVDPGVWLNLVDATDPVLIGQATSSIKRKLAKNTSSMNVLVPLGEIRELRTLLVQVAMSGMELLKTLAAMQKGFSRGSNALKKLFAESWLAWSFGIAPTLSEIQNINIAISSYLLAERRSVTLSSIAKKEWFSTAKALSMSGAFGTVNDYTFEARHTLSYRMVAGFNIDVKSSNNYGLDNQFGIEFGALPSVGWELTPFSWLFDYFSTMGAYLEDAFWTPPGTTTYISQTRRYSVDVVVTCKTRSTADTLYASSINTPGSYKYFSIERTPLTALPHAQLRFKTTDEIGRNVVNRLLNLASLGAKSVRF